MSTLSPKLIILAIAAIANILLLITVYKRDPRSATHKIFVALGVVITLWLFASYFSTTPETNLLWSRITIFFASLMTMLLFLFAHTLPARRFRLGAQRALGIYASTAAVMAITVSPYAFTGVGTDGGTYKLVIGPGMGAFAALATTFSFLTVFTLWKKLTSASGAAREQVRFVLTGVFLMLGFLIGTVMLPVLLFQEDIFVSLISLYTLVFLGMSGYAIARYRLFDIRFIIARAVAYTVVVSIIALVYVSVLFLVVPNVLGLKIDWIYFSLGFPLTLLAMFTFQPLQARLRALTNKFFFKEEYDSDKLLAALTRIMAETIDLDHLTTHILEKVTTEMKISEAAFLMVKNHRIMEVKSHGYRNARFVLSKELEDLFHQYVAQDHRFVFDDLSEGVLKDIFRTLNISVAIPIRVEKDEVAILVLGVKSSGEIYSEKDIHALDIFASEAGIAMQNAQSYAEIKKLSKELETRVEERTQQLKGAQERELAKAREVARLKDEFVFIAAHELRTPVAAIRGFLELVSESTTHFPKDVRENLQAISQASGHLNQLIDDLLQIARSEAGTIKISVAPVHLLPIIKAVVEELTPIAGERHITIAVDAHSILPRVFVDAQKVREIAVNLLSNAIKYNRDGGRVDVNMFRQGEAVVCEIRDAGYGIPKNQQEKIFEKFFRAHTEGTERVLGTGLGLFISRMLVEKMGGSIAFSSKEGAGTTFSFSFPIAPTGA